MILNTVYILSRSFKKSMTSASHYIQTILHLVQLVTKRSSLLLFFFSDFNEWRLMFILRNIEKVIVKILLFI